MRTAAAADLPAVPATISIQAAYSNRSPVSLGARWYETAAKRRVPNWHAYVLTTWDLSRIVVPSGSELTVYDINRRAEAMRIPSTVPVLLTDKLLVTRDTRHLLRLHMF
jgi:hypothetical protein